MQASVAWFGALVLSTAVLSMLGRRAAGLTPRVASALGLLALLMLMTLSYVGHHATMMLAVLPLSVVQYLEGTVGLPLLGFVLALAWVRSQCLRQRLVVGSGAAVSLGVLLYAAGWMILPTPNDSFSRYAATVDSRQSTDYSCVATASAIALGQIGLPSSEEQMARLTRTRPMTGASVIRAAWALNQRLVGTGVEARVMQADWQTLQSLPMPALATLQFDRRRMHMVAVIEVRPTHALIVDPNDGVMWFPRGAFEMHSDGSIIILDRPAGDATHQQLAHAEWSDAAQLSWGR